MESEIKTTDKKELILQEPKVYAIAVTNLYNALNKANLKGAFELKESRQLCNDLDLIASLITQLNK